MRVVKQLRKTIIRYPIETAQYKMIHSYHRSARVNFYQRIILDSRYDYSRDSINTIQYQLHRVTFYKLFILFNVTLIAETYQQI